MRLLLDTHTVIWASRQPESLSQVVRSLLTDLDNERLISAVVPWEMSLKVLGGKLPEAQPLLAGFDEVVSALVAQELPISRRHAIVAGQMAWEHKDPFDRMLAAQAVIEGLTLVSKDPIFTTAPDVRVLW